jgi:uncharacterized membrane protein SpoIIM required for sporulation
MFLHNLLNILVQIANKMRLQKTFGSVLISAVTFIPSRCLATVRGMHIQWDITKCTVETGSGASYIHQVS